MLSVFYRKVSRGFIVEECADVISVLSEGQQRIHSGRVYRCYQCLVRRSAEDS